MSPRGVNLVHTVLSGAMRHALRMELIMRNPVALVSPPPQQKREANPPPIAAVREALALARSDDHHLSACIHLIAYTGLRRGEALGLTWDNVNLEGSYLQVRASLVRSRERGLVLDRPRQRAGDGGWTWTQGRWKCCGGTGSGRMGSSGSCETATRTGE